MSEDAQGSLCPMSTEISLKMWDGTTPVFYNFCLPPACDAGCRVPIRGGRRREGGGGGGVIHLPSDGHAAHLQGWLLRRSVDIEPKCRVLGQTFVGFIGHQALQPHMSTSMMTLQCSCSRGIGMHELIILSGPSSAPICHKHLYRLANGHCALVRG